MGNSQSAVTVRSSTKPEDPSEDKPDVRTQVSSVVSLCPCHGWLDVWCACQYGVCLTFYITLTLKLRSPQRPRRPSGLAQQLEGLLANCTLPLTSTASAAPKLLLLYIYTLYLYLYHIFFRTPKQLPNYGYSGWLNVVLQPLLHAPPLRNFFLTRTSFRKQFASFFDIFDFKPM